MPWTNITKPAVGDPTKKTAFADAVIDDLNYLYNTLLSVIGTRDIVINSSFESDSDTDGVPDGWDLTLFSGGTFSHEISTVAGDDKSAHGGRSVKFTSPGGGGAGGGYLETQDFFEVTPSKWIGVFFQLKSTAAGVDNLVTVEWYDSAQAHIASSTVWAEGVNNPSSWTPFFGFDIAPANARFAKLIIVGCSTTGSTAGSTWFDDVRLITLDMQLKRRVEFSTAGSYKWLCPADVKFVVATVVGGGASGGHAVGGSGGGSGGNAFGMVPVTPGTLYDVTVGAGGASVNGGNNGIDGGTSTFQTLSATGGIKGLTEGGAGGAAGTGSGGSLHPAGNAGSARVSGLIGGNGGHSTWYGTVGYAGQSATLPLPAFGYGAGGGGNGNSTASGAGADGVVILEF